METTQLRKAVFKKIADIEPQQRYNLYVQVIKVESNVVIKRVDEEPVKMSICLVGDDTGCARVLLKDAQVAHAKEGELVILRNANAKIIKERVRLEVDIWGKVEKLTEKKFGEVNRKNNISEVEYEAVMTQ